MPGGRERFFGSGELLKFILSRGFVLKMIHKSLCKLSTSIYFCGSNEVQLSATTFGGSVVKHGGNTTYLFSKGNQF